MNKRGLTAWGAVRQLLLEAEMEIKPDRDLRSGGTTWVDTEYYKKYGLLQLLDWVADGTWYAKGRRTPLDPNKQDEHIPKHLWAVGLLKMYPDDNTVSGGGLEYIRVLYYEGEHKPVVMKAPRPKGKGGNRRTFNDKNVVEKARAIRKSSGVESKMEAARQAMLIRPKLYNDRGTPESTAKRIAKQI